LFGRVPSGPLSILKETWEGKREVDVTSCQPVDQYIADLEQNMRNAEKYAREHSTIEQQRYVKYYNAHAKDKSFQTGEQVLVLEKDSSHKLFARWKLGKILRIRSPYTYDVQFSDGSCRQLHANKIRPLVARIQNVGIIREQDVDFGDVDYAPLLTDTSQALTPSAQIEGSELSHLDENQQAALLSVLDEFPDVFADYSGLCTVIEHEIHVTLDFKPRMTKAYRVRETLKLEIEKQVDELLKLGFIVPSKSPMASGVVCVLKPDYSIRMACDYRYLNSYTVSDAFPMPNLHDVMHRVGRASFI